jgi:pyrroline-5-carboxylate reductase
MLDLTISFIGAGYMGGALIGGLIAAGQKPSHLWASCPDQAYLNPLHDRYGIHITNNNLECVSHADVLILAVKPQIIQQVIAEIASITTERKPLIISIAAGVEINTLQQSFQTELAIIRAMPNTPALIRSGATALYANHLASTQHKQLAEHIFAAVGTTVWLEEEQQLLAVAALSGSGPAYFFLLLECLQETAAHLGLPENIATQLITQTALGSARMAAESDVDFHGLLKQVVSKGGGTEKALSVLEKEGFREAILHALTEAKLRYIELMQGSLPC